MKHSPIHSARKVPRQLADQAHAWIVERGANGKLEEQLDPGFLGTLEENEIFADIDDVLADASARLHVAKTRLW